MRKRDPRPYVGLHKEVVFGSEWAALSPHARDLYLLLKGKYNPRKNGGAVKLSYRELKKKISYKGLKRTATVAKAYRELESRGWITKEDKGGGLYGKATFYVFTRKFDQYGLRESGQ